MKILIDNSMAAISAAGNKDLPADFTSAAIAVSKETEQGLAICKTDNQLSESGN